MRLSGHEENGFVTIKFPDTFARSRPAQFDGVFDWDFLKGCWTGKIEPMDIDGLVERNGHFLLFETKDPHRTISKGQKIALARLVDVGRGRITLCVIRGKNHETVNGF